MRHERPYWSAILEHLPGASIVFDHFHSSKSANEKIDDLPRALQREAEVLGYQTLKGSRDVPLTGREKTSASVSPRPPATALATNRNGQ